MKKRLQGLLAGILIGVMCSGGVLMARTGTETISVLYDNIKVYKDNVLCELKDGNGSTIEPFIYNGTTYLPVRGTAQLADMQVTWDGATKSVYLWDNMVAAGTYLVDVCPAYDSSGFYVYLQNKGESFEMAGKKYSNGYRSYWGPSSPYLLFNLDSKYTALECTIGHEDWVEREKTVTFLVDGRVVQEVTLEPECLPKTISVPLQYGLQLKIVTDCKDVGIGNITIR